jgi:hypothetical protein
VPAHVGALGCLVTLFVLACNGILGITDTSNRGEAGTPGQGAGAASSGAVGGNGSVGTQAACTTNAECLDQSGEYDPSACIAGVCQKLLTPECPLALPQTERRWLENLRHAEPDPVIFGIFTDVPAGLFGLFSKNYDLALTEVARAVGGIPAAGGKRRPVLAVACKNIYATSDEFDRAIDHLADDLQVPGILAVLEASDLEYAFRRKGRDHHIFFASALEADRALMEIGDGLLWSMLSQGEELALTYGPLLERTVKHLQSAGRLAPDELVRVALVTTDDVRMLSSMSSALVEGVLQINGLPAHQNSVDTFRAVSIPSSDLASVVPDYTAAIRLLRDFSPHIVIGAATDEFLTTIIPALEADTRELAPFYLLSPWHDNPGQLVPLLVDFPELYARLAGVNFAAAEDTTVYDAYQARFDAAFPAFAGTRGLDNHYDAAYYLIYAAAAAGTKLPLIGSDLANGMQRLLSGRLAFSVGPDDLFPAYVALETPGSSIVLNGAMGPPNFDPHTGAREEPGTVWCVDKKRVIHNDVLRLDADGNLNGSFPCFDFAKP